MAMANIPPFRTQAMIDDEAHVEAFSQLIQRMGQAGPAPQDVAHVQHIAAAHPVAIRHPDPVPTSDQLMNEDYRDSMMGRNYESAAKGLAANGWSEFGHRSLGSGSFGAVHVGFRFSDRNLQYEHRLLCAIKVIEEDPRDEESWDMVPDEIAFMRCLAHPNIVGYYCNFTVTPKEGTVEKTQSFLKQGLQPSPKRPTYREMLLEREKEMQARREGKHLSPGPSRARSDSSHAPRTRQLPAGPMRMYILMEFADAGNMKAEIYRYDVNRIPESGARYYGKQIAAGVAHLHWVGLMHNDLHAKNVLLKFLPDGRTKKAMICDFGRAYLIEDPDESVAEDVAKVFTLIRTMVVGFRTIQNAQKMMETGISWETVTFLKHPDRIKDTWRVRDLMGDRWFSLPSEAPIPPVRHGPENLEQRPAAPATHYSNPPVHVVDFEYPNAPHHHKHVPTLAGIPDEGVPPPGHAFHDAVLPGDVLQAGNLRAKVDESFPHEKQRIEHPITKPGTKTRSSQGEPIIIPDPLIVVRERSQSADTEPKARPGRGARPRRGSNP